MKGKCQYCGSITSVDEVELENRVENITISALLCYDCSYYKSEWEVVERLFEKKEEEE